MADLVTQQELETLNQHLESQSPQEVLSYGLSQYFPRIILACSFGAEDVVLIDMIHRINPKAPLFYLDTDFLFPETYAVRDRIIAKYALLPEQVLQIKSRLTPDEQATQFGPSLWTHNPNQCCNLRKIEPLTRVLKNYRAWITGIRRDQAPTRANTPLVEWDTTFELAKLNPLARWTHEDVWAYIREHNVPYNVLHDQHYPSIGCTHCTGPVMPGEDPRSGRWRDLEKTECGLHKSST